MTDDARSGSRWEPQHGREEPAQQPLPPPQQRKRPLAALTAAGLVLIGGAGGWAIGTGVAGDDPAVQETGVDGGTPGGVPQVPGGRLPDPDGDPA